MLRRGIDIRYVVTSLQRGDAEHVYATDYCARGQAENLIEQHKAQLSSDRTSCRSPLANQMRLSAEPSECCHNYPCKMLGNLCILQGRSCQNCAIKLAGLERGVPQPKR
jgi:hypothetical protein